MSRVKQGQRQTEGSDDAPIGPILAKNLYRLRYAAIVVNASELSRLVSRTGKGKMTRQRISALMNAVRIEPETIALLADAIVVKPGELTRPVEIKVIPATKP